jgi:hypothetical protein
MAAKRPREKPRTEPMVVWVERREAADWSAVRSEAWRLWSVVSILDVRAVIREALARAGSVAAVLLVCKR